MSITDGQNHPKFNMLIDINVTLPVIIAVGRL